MFEKPTVFILGAGASWHYNYPTGEDLVKRVVDKTQTLIECYEKDIQLGHVSPSTIINRIYEGSNSPHDSVLSFLEDFVDRILHVDPPVIDYFLAWNEDLQDIGKLMIAWVILDREREYIARGRANVNRELIHKESPYIDKRRQDVDITAFKDNWYRFILYKIASECKEAARLNENHVQFITFNYDVSLETYLYKGLRQIKFLKGDNGEIDLFLNNRFVHMYGSIRKDPFIDPVNPIKNEPNSKVVKGYRDILETAYKASQGIRTIGDDKDDPKAITKAKEMIEEAEDIYILGYGFDGNNSSRLNLEKLLHAGDLNERGKKEKSRVQKRIYFTNFEDSNSVNKKASKIFTGNPNAFLPGKDAIYKPKNSSHSDLTYEKSIRNVYDALERDFDFL